MADKSKQRARALQRKTGMSCQAAHNALTTRSRQAGETREEPKKLRDTYALEQLREAILSLREQDVGDPNLTEVLTEVQSLTHIPVKQTGLSEPVQIVPVDSVEWVLDGNSWKLVLTLDLGTETFEGSVETWLAEVAKNLKCTIELSSFDGKLADVVVRVGKTLKPKPKTRPLSNLESMQQHIQDLLENPVMRQIQQMQNVLDNPFVKLMRQQQEIADTFRLNDIGRHARELQAAVSGPPLGVQKWFEDAREIQAAFASPSGGLRDVIQSFQDIAEPFNKAQESMLSWVKRPAAEDDSE